MPDPEPVPPATPARPADWEAFYRDYRKPGYVAGFEITTKLGGGMFGLVFRARKQSIGKDYAIKFLQVDDTEVRRAVLAELEAVKLFAQIDHPNLVSIEDRGEVDGIPFLVMAFAGTETLKDKIPTDGVPPVGEAKQELVRYFLQACRGLAALHERSLVHFDIKPANVFLKGPVARLGDYGLSKLVTHSRGSLSMGRGTPYYMAPEMLQRRGDHRSDIYSLGVLLYEILCGSVPFRGDSEWEVLRKHEHEAPTLPGHLSGPERMALQRCLQKDPGARFQSVHELIAALGAPASASAAALGDAAVDSGGGANGAEWQPPPPPPASEGPDPYTGFRRASKEALLHAGKIARDATSTAREAVQKAAKQAQELVREQLRKSGAGEPTWWSEFRQKGRDRAAAKAAAKAARVAAREARRARRRSPLVTALFTLVFVGFVFSWLIPARVVPRQVGVSVGTGSTAAVRVGPDSLYRAYDVPAAYQGLVSMSEPAWVQMAAADPAVAKAQLEEHLARIRRVAPFAPSERARSSSVPKLEAVRSQLTKAQQKELGQRMDELVREGDLAPELGARLREFAPESLAMAAERLARLQWKEREDLEAARRLQAFLVEATGCQDLQLVDDESLALAKLAAENRLLGRLWSLQINEIAQTPRTWQVYLSLRDR
ncbi:MAG: serine/threonine protein kinase [Planctomycetes bacterium]|nr:serine/threonine protein kinase [Planctomycetota bacterium]